MPNYIDIVFDTLPGPEGGHFIETESPEGASINAGEWVQREDGYWVLRIRRIPINMEHFDAEVKDERARQILRGYDLSHDRKHGARHLWRLAYHYVSNGDMVKAAAMMQAESDLHWHLRRERYANPIRKVGRLLRNVWYAILDIPSALVDAWVETKEGWRGNR